MTRWVSGNRFWLLENGEAFFPRVFDAIENAKREVLIETFILFEDKVGLALHAVLLQAAARGVQIDITVDGFGSPDLSPQFIGALAQAGARLHVFDPSPRLWGWRTNVFRRLHRKIVVVDGQRAFVGGINYSADHLADFGPQAKQDYSVEIEGPIVAVIHDFACAALTQGQGQAPPSLGRHLRQRLSDKAHTLAHGWRQPPAPAGHAAAIFVTRDNRLHTTDIERHYRIALRAARQRVVIANAYFFPGYRLLKEMRRAARRGVNVQLILQGEPDMAIVKTAAGMLYYFLLSAGVQIFEYTERPLHGKVAVFDDELATVGSSNLDPLSLSLNLEANVIIKDQAFNQDLAERLAQMMARSCRQIRAEDLSEPSWWRIVRSFFVFHLLSRYPAWAGWLPAHAPRLTLAGAPPGGRRGAVGRLTRSARSIGWPWLRRGAAGVFFALVGYALVSRARSIDWGQVLTALQDYPAATLWGAAGLAGASYALYSCFDLLGRHYTGHRLGTRKVMLLTFVSYAFNLNLGSLLGGMAFRYRLYSRLGLGLGVIARVTSLSMLANWMGYLLLGGLVFSLQPLALPPSWQIDAAQLRLSGAGLLALALAYLGACALSRQRTFDLRGHAVELPSLRLASLQLGMGAANWLLMSGILFVLLRQRIDFFSVVSVLLLAAVAGVIAHIPGNLGVLEAVFVALLAPRLPAHDVLAALVAYRILYYLIPLGLATLLYLLMETRSRPPAARAPEAPPRPP